MPKSKLHEILAVEKSLENAAKKLSQESAKTLGKENLFLGMVKVFTMFAAEKDNLSNYTEEVKMESTVDENLDYLMPFVASWYDVVLQKDATNQMASADIVLPDGTVLADNLPATFLLGLEAKLLALRELYMHIPTLAPGVNWQPDASNEKAGVFVTPLPQVNFKTEKVMDFQVVVQPTEFHPAEVRDVQRTENVGRYETTRTSGMLSPVEKARRISNIDTLMVAVKKARMRANTAEVVDVKVGAKLLDFINKP